MGINPWMLWLAMRVVGISHKNVENFTVTSDLVCCGILKMNSKRSGITL